MTNIERFIEALTKAYVELFESDPKYAYSAQHTTPEALAVKMTKGLAQGSANKDGAGIRRACKVCGIKHTYQAIRTYLGTGL
jgi:hypothetical protein